VYRATYHSEINFPFKLPIILESKTMNMSLKEKYPFEGTSIFSYQREYKIEMRYGSFIVESSVKE